MAVQHDFSRSFQVNAAMSAGRVVAISNNGKIGLAAINTRGVGVLQEDTTAEAYENPKVRLYGTGTVRVAVTGTPLTAGDTLYTVTNGLVAGTNGSIGTAQIFGTLLETTGASANGTLAEALPQVV